MKNKIFLPDFYNVFEIKSCKKNRIRMEIKKLINNPVEVENLKNSLQKIDLVKEFKIISSLGSVTVVFDDTQIDSQFMLSIILKLIGLENEIFKKRTGKLKNIFNNLISFTDITLYNKSKGLLDTKTLAATLLLAYGIKKLKTTPALPAGATLIWWAYNLFTKDIKDCE